MKNLIDFFSNISTDWSFQWQGIVAVFFIITVLSLLLRSWNPPIKGQYQFLILLSVALPISIILIYSWIVGIVSGVSITGLIFYKDKMAEDIIATKNVINTLKENGISLSDFKNIVNNDKKND